MRYVAVSGLSIVSNFQNRGAIFRGVIPTFSSNETRLVFGPELKPSGPLSARSETFLGSQDYGSKKRI